MILTTSEKDHKSEWVMDSGCKFYITLDRDALFDFKEFEGGKVLMRNNTFSEVKGMGKLKIINSEGATVILTDVRYMPTVPGEYAVHILCDDEDIPKSPYVVQILPKGDFHPELVGFVELSNIRMDGMIMTLML